MTKVSQITFFDGIYEVTMAAYVFKTGQVSCLSMV